MYIYIYIYIHIYVYICIDMYVYVMDMCICSYMYMYICMLGAWSLRVYGVALVSRIDKIIGFFCKRAPQKRRYSAKETCNFIDPANSLAAAGSEHTHIHVCIYKYIHIYIYMYVYIYTYINTHTYVYICTHMCRYNHRTARTYVISENTYL